MSERLKEIKIKVNNTDEPMLYIPYTDVNWLVEQTERVDNMQKLVNYHQQKQKEAEDANEPYRHQNRRYREALESMKSEINYALHSNKSKDVKRFYLENAARFADEALAKEE